MKRRQLILLSLATALAPASVWSAPVEEQIIRQLREQGYTRFRVGRTLLGRTRIVATGGGQNREIIFNPRTGEILRDYWEDEDEDAEIIDPDGRDDDDDNGDGRRGSDDDDDDDDGGGGGRNDDDDDGRGNGGNGSGGGGGGSGGDENDDDDGEDESDDGDSNEESDDDDDDG